MKAIKILSKCLLMLALAVAVPMAAEARGGHGKGHGPGGEFMKAIEKLDLSADQKKKLKEMRESTKDSMRSKRQAMKAAHEELEAALHGSATDEEVKKKFEVMKAASDEFMRARFDKVLSIRSILTPEQRTKFKELRGTGHGPMDHDEE